MKTFIALRTKAAFLIMLSFFLIANTFAQKSTKQAKEAKTAADVKSMIEAKSYVFIAQYIQPMRGGSRYITPDYDFKVGRDSLEAYLPYFGRAYVAPMNPDDASMKFTATKFDYTVVEKKDRWEISIKPSDAKDVRAVQLSISKNGYATLQIISNNRDAIRYQGYIEAKKQKV